MEGCKESSDPVLVPTNANESQSTVSQLKAPSSQIDSECIDTQPCDEVYESIQTDNEPVLTLDSNEGTMDRVESQSTLSQLEAPSSQIDSDSAVIYTENFNENLDTKPCDEVHESVQIDNEPVLTLDTNEGIMDLAGTNNTNKSDNNCDDADGNLHEQTISYENIYDFSRVPVQITGSWNEFNYGLTNNFTRGCKWAPDGSCILSCSADNILRLFNLPAELWKSDTSWDDICEMESVLKVNEGELVYDYCWYPMMSSNDPSTCCFAASSRSSALHLWDAFTGELRCTYRSYNNVDEIVAPYSLSFDAECQRIFCGFEKMIRIFNINIPGRNFEERPTLDKNKIGVRGILSCFAFTSANTRISAVGSYQKTIGIYSEPSGQLECVLEGQAGGLTQLQFSPDGNLLYSAGRKDPDILCWDLRNLGDILFTLRRVNVTNQRMYFDISSCGKYLVSGNTNGIITVWDTSAPSKEVEVCDYPILEPVMFYRGHNDCVNGISLHPTLPLMCTSSGQRQFPDPLSDDEDDKMFDITLKGDNCLRLWWTGKTA